MTTPGQPPDEPEEQLDIDLDALPELDVEIRQVGQIRTVRQQQEKIRGILALSLTAIFGVVLIWPFIFIILNGTWADTKEWLTIALPAITGLLGSAMGFYFGQRNRNN